MKHITDRNISEVAQLINRAENICLIGHHNPDGDAVAGCLALGSVLQKHQKKCRILMPSDMPDFLKFLPGSDQIIFDRGDTHAGKPLLNQADLIICVDFNAASRVKQLKKALIEAKAPKILLDHHPQPEDFTDYIISKTESSSASEIVLEFIEMLGFKSYIDKDIAATLYTGIMTDTLNFSIQTAGAKTFARAAELLACGFDKEQIYEQVYSTYSWNRLKLTGHLIDTQTHRIEKHRAAYILFSQQAKEAFQYRLGDHEGIVNMPLSVEDIEVSFLFMDNKDNIKVSLRSKGSFNVNEFARKYLNGGGHERAAGGQIQVDWEKIPEFLESKLDEYSKA